MKDLAARAEALAAPQPYLIVSDAAAAIAFYRAAFGAIELERVTAESGDRIAHALLEAFGAPLMLADDAGAGQGLRAPSALGATTVTLHVDLVDRAAVDRVLDAAAAAGATVTFPAREMDWGARYGRILDPFGHAWSFAGAA